MLLYIVRSVRPGKLGELEISRTSKSFLRSVTAPIIIDVCRWVVPTREVSSAEIYGNLSLRLYKVSPFPAQPKGEGKRVLVREKFIK